MAIDRETVRQIARLAYLELPRTLDAHGRWTEPTEHLIDDARLDRLARELGAILEHVAEIGRLDLKDVEPTSHGVPLPPRLRADELGEALSTERALEGAPRALEGGFAVPKVVDYVPSALPSPLELPLSEVSARLDRAELSSTQLLRASLDWLDATQSLNAFLQLDPKGAEAAARAADDRIAKKKRLSPLDGVPIAVKDNFVTEGTRTTAGSKILGEWVPPYDGTVVRKLKEAGAVIVGKTNLDEFAMGSSSERSAFGAVKNPWDETRVAGGSSGGSAAAVAARQVFGSYGTDTGGSIRQPAALTGILGLKPTYGRVSRAGIIAYASSLDQVGPFGRTALDLAHLLQAVAGPDPLDSTSAEEPVPDYAAAVRSAGDLKGVRVGVPKEYFGEGLDPEIERSVKAATEALAAAGATLHDISLPHTRYALSSYYLIAPAEAASNLARFDGVRYGLRVEDKELRRMISRTRSAGFGEEVQRRIILGTYVLSAGYYDAYYGQAQKVRTLIRRDFEDAFRSVDLIATPTSPIAAFPLNSRLDDPLSMYLADVCTLAVNLAGVPALSVPCGLTGEGLPVGLQLISPWFVEASLLTAARVLEVRGIGLGKDPKIIKGVAA